MIFRENRINEKQGKSGIFGFLRRSLGNPCLRRSVGCPRRDEAGVPKWRPLGYATVKTLFTVRKFRIFVPKVSYSYSDSLRTLIND